MSSRGTYQRPDADLDDKGRKKKITLSKRAGLDFPVTRIKRLLRKNRYANKVAVDSAIYLTAVVEYVAAEVLSVASQATRAHRRKTINPRHIRLAVYEDAELHGLFRHATIAGGGAIPNLRQELLPKHKQLPKSIKDIEDKKRAAKKKKAQQKEAEEQDKDDDNNEAGDDGKKSDEKEGEVDVENSSLKLSKEQDNTVTE